MKVKIEMSNIEKAVSILADNGHTESSIRLATHAAELRSKDKEKALLAGKNICELCNIKVLGDLNIKNTEGWEWPTLLEKISQTTKKKMRTINEIHS